MLTFEKHGKREELADTCRQRATKSRAGGGRGRKTEARRGEKKRKVNGESLLIAHFIRVSISDDDEVGCNNGHE